MIALKGIGYFSAFLIPTFVIVGYNLGGGYIILPVIFVFGIVPLIDLLLGIDKSNPDENIVPELAGRFYYKFVLYLWAFIEFAFLIFAFYAVTVGNIQLLTERIAFTIGVALVTGGIGITVAHELGHKKSAWEQFLSKFLLMMVCYMHFFIEHNKGHHVNVATPGDPATARKGENFYAFWWRSVTKGYISAWKIENGRLSRKGSGALSLSNQMIWFSILPVIFCGVVMITFWVIYNQWFIEIPVFFFSQSLVAFSLLELTNYVEHYGIVRKEVAPGRYERVDERHSWNASHLFSNFFLFQLQRHSDHHLHAIKPYQVLKHYDSSPQLPAGYPTMVILAAIPPLWHRMIDHRLEKWEQSKISVDLY